MKNKFSTKWKESKQPRKQRKYLANAPLHLRKKFVNVNLSKELRKKQNRRNIQINKGDKVKIMRGGFRGQTGKILEVNIKKSLIVIEGMQAKKRDGSKVNIKFQPSNLQIIELSERLKKTQAENKLKETKPVETKSHKKIKRLKSNISSDLSKESQVNEKTEQTEVKK